MASNRTFTTQEISNLKRLATKRKKADPGLTHSGALDQLATEAGFSNWSMLMKAAGSATPVIAAAITRAFEVRVSGWVLQSGAPGRRIQSFWHTYIPTRYESKHYQPCKRVPENWDVKGSSLENTIMRMEQLRMNIAFMDATELRPSKAWSSLFPDHRFVAPLDHQCVWRTADGNYVVSNEPYRGSEKREGAKKWCEANGWTWEELPKGIGMHNTCSKDCPDDCKSHTTLILMSPPKRNANLKQIANCLKTHFHELNKTDISPGSKLQLA
ncbi:MAG TPA: hypothetical protein VEC06_17415 [Paucimonas sp.]|nr:hypothetical protein [Paucimonas sp.]